MNKNDYIELVELLSILTAATLLIMGAGLLAGVAVPVLVAYMASGIALAAYRIVRRRRLAVDTE